MLDSPRSIIMPETWLIAAAKASGFVVGVGDRTFRV